MKIKYKILTLARWILMLVAMQLSGCAKLPVKLPPVCSMVPVSDDSARLPEFYDDASLASLDKALSESISFWRHQDPERQLKVCDKSYRAAQLLDTLLEFNKILHHTPKAELSDTIAQNFTVYQAKGRNGGDTLVTGYFQPVLRAVLCVVRHISVRFMVCRQI